jgi:hypothetical protein
MSQRSASPMRASVSMLMIEVVLFAVTPCQVIAQTTQTAGLMPASVPAAPASPAPPRAPATPLPPSPPNPPAPPGPPHPIDKPTGTHASSEHVQVSDDNIITTSGDVEGGREAKLQPPSRAQKKVLDNKRRSPGYQQWLLGERQRVVNEAARREADRMINAASPMDWRNRYSSD